MSASNVIPYDTNVSNFVSVKLSGRGNYLLWKAQMLCLLESVNVCGILDNTFVVPRDSGPKTVRQYENLVKGWIFGSVSEVVLEEVYYLNSAKNVWEKLQSNYDPTMLLQEKEDPPLTQVTVDEDIPTDTEKMMIDKHKNMKLIRSLILKLDWPELESMLNKKDGLAEEPITSDVDTVLHLAVGMHRNYIVNRLLNYMRKKDKEHALEKRSSDGSTVLHIAASIGNTRAAIMLLNTHKNLLGIQDNNGDHPLRKAYENMHLDTIACLLKAEKDHPEYQSFLPDDKFAVDLLVNAISVRRYCLAKDCMEKFPQAASRTDDVLMALAKTFPSGLEDRDKLFYPSMKNTVEMMRKTAWSTAYLISLPVLSIQNMLDRPFYKDLKYIVIGVPFIVIFQAPFNMFLSATTFIYLIILIIRFPFFLLYYILWKGAFILKFLPIEKLEIKIIEQKEAKEFLLLVCDKIDNVYLGKCHPYYNGPILEAACQNAYEVVEEILSRLPVAIKSQDESGYDTVQLVQLAIMNRSDKIFNLIHDIDDQCIHRHRNFLDSSENNILHLAGRLAPSRVLNKRTGAALQLQHELQWYEKVKTIVFPTFITQKNNFEETPDMVFTREHANLLKEGEKWMKTTAESCSITASLITTIVFAAAITVPGGTSQEKGTPLFNKEPAFIIFAISDAISLFASSTALLVFLSILTARFAEKDFLVSLPWRLFIGLSSLLLSTTSMIVAFSATLFLVFCDKKLWMLAPICGLALIPIAIFVGLQFPLMVDLFSSTYVPIFDKERQVTIKNIIKNVYKTLKLLFHDPTITRI